MIQEAQQNLLERLKILEELFQQIIDPKNYPDTKEQQQLEMWSE